MSEILDETVFVYHHCSIKLKRIKHTFLHNGIQKGKQGNTAS